MNQGKYIFAQLTDFLPRRVFDRIVDKYEGNKRIRSFTCWNQMLCMVFGQLTARDSMRDLMLSLEAHQSKYYHLGFGPTVSRRNLGTANEKRNCKIFEEFAYVLISEARRSCYRNDFEIEVDGNVYALDSTTIDLCLSVFWWAEFRKHKGGIKLHTLFDIKTSIPGFIRITTAKVHDVNIMDLIPYERGSFYVADKAYTDFYRLNRINANGSFFVIRAKENLKFKRMYSRVVDKTTGVINDQIGRLLVPKSRSEYPEKLRRIKYYDAEHNLKLVFLTNNMDLNASEIAFLYKKRWEVGVSSEGHITQSVKVRPESGDSSSVAWEAPPEETKAVKPSDTVSNMGNKQHSRLQRAVNAEVASLHLIPVAETVYNVRKQQELSEKSLMRQLSPAGYQRWHGVKGYVETGEALDTRRRNIAEEAVPITLSGKWDCRYQGDGSGRSTYDRHAAKRAGREGPGPMSNPYVQFDAGVR